MSKFWDVDYINQKRRKKESAKYVKLPLKRKKVKKKFTHGQELFENSKENVMISAQNKIFNRGIYHVDDENTIPISKQYVSIVLSKNSQQMKKEYNILLEMLSLLPFPPIQFYEKWFENNKITK